MIANRGEILNVLGVITSLTNRQLALADMVHRHTERLVKDYLQNDIEQATHIEYYPPQWRTGSTGSHGDLVSADIDIRDTMVAFRPGGRGSDVIILKHTPVIFTDLEVYEDPNAHGGQNTDAFPASTLLTAGTDYWLDLDETGLSRTGILRRDGAWPVEPRSVRVRYTGGWSRTQLDNGPASPIKMAVLLTAVKAMKQIFSLQATESGAVVSRTTGTYKTVYDETSSALNFGLQTALPVEAEELLRPFRSYRLF